MKIPFKFNPIGKSKEDAKNYLTFTALQNNSSVRFVKFDYANIRGIQYSVNGGDWTQYPTSGYTINLGLDDYVQFRNTDQTMSTSQYDYVKCFMSGKIAASGDIMSMYDFA